MRWQPLFKSNTVLARPAVARQRDYFALENTSFSAFASGSMCMISTIRNHPTATNAVSRPDCPYAVGLQDTRSGPCNRRHRGLISAVLHGQSLPSCCSELRNILLWLGPRSLLHDICPFSSITSARSLLVWSSSLCAGRVSIFHSCSLPSSARITAYRIGEAHNCQHKTAHSQAPARPIDIRGYRRTAGRGLPYTLSISSDFHFDSELRLIVHPANNS